MDKQEIVEFQKKVHAAHRKVCDNCMSFNVGACGGIRYNPVVKKPLCEKGQRAYDKCNEEVKNG